MLGAEDTAQALSLLHRNSYLQILDFIKTSIFIYENNWRVWITKCPFYNHSPLHSQLEYRKYFATLYIDQRIYKKFNLLKALLLGAYTGSPF